MRFAVAKHFLGRHRWTWPLTMTIQRFGKKLTLLDDYVASARCQVTPDKKHGAVFLDCLAMDRGVWVRAYQKGDELIVDFAVRPDSAWGSERFKLPHGSRVKYVMHFPATQQQANP